MSFAGFRVTKSIFFSQEAGNLAVNDNPIRLRSRLHEHFGVTSRAIS